MPQINQCTNQNIRNWHHINEAYVTQGVLLLQHDWVDGWDNELEMMNDRKSGRPYKFPESLIRFAETLKMVPRLPLRQLEGFLQALACFLRIEVPDYTTLWHRECQSQVHLPAVDLVGSGWELAVDSPGIEVSDRGEWMREKWHVHRGWIKVHMCIEVTIGAIVGLIVCDEKARDASYLPILVEQASRLLPGRIARVIADGGYDTYDNFDHLVSRGIEPVINMRCNASRKRHGHSSARPKAVRERDDLGEAEWKARHGYNMRWKVETMFSAIKRKMGKSVRSKRPGLAQKQAERMVVQYSMLKEVTC